MILLLIVILLGSYFILFYSGFQLKSVIISGNVKTKNQDLQKIIHEYSHNQLFDYANIKIGSDSIFLINKDKIGDRILREFPDIEKVLIDIKLPQSLFVKIVERNPIGSFCDNENNCYLIDQNGVIFDQLSALPVEGIILRQANDGGQLFSGKRILEQRTMSAITIIKQNLKENFQIDLKDVLVSSSVRLNIDTSLGWKIYFDTSVDSSIDSQITKLDLLLNKELSAEEKSNLKYIDLRPKDRAIVCDNKVCGG